MPIPQIELTILLLIVLALQASADDPDLARRIRAGDQEAFREFFEAHYDVLSRYLSAQGFAAIDCRDVVQRAFVAVWTERRRIQPDKPLRAYLFRIARNAALNDLRKAARHSPLNDAIDVADSSEAAVSQDDGPLNSQIAAAVSNLSARRREVIELCFLGGLTYAEAADVLNIARKTVENQVGLALKDLRSALGLTGSGETVPREGS